MLVPVFLLSARSYIIHLPFAAVSLIRVDLMICDICGVECPADAKHCSNCGYPFREPSKDSAPPLSSPVVQPAAAAISQTASQPRGLENTEASPPVDPALIRNILAETEKAAVDAERRRRMAAAKSVPGLIALIALGALAASLVQPWMHLLPNRIFTAWRMPVGFLVIGRGGGLPYLSVGVVLAACLIVGLVRLWLSLRPASSLQTVGLISFLVSLAVIILAMRFWGASLSVGDAFPQLMKQKIILNDRSYETVDRFFGIRNEAPAGEGWERPPSGLAFLGRMLGPGVFLALIAGIILMLLPVVLGNDGYGYTAQIHTTFAAVVVTLGILVVAAMLVYEFFPARWYATRAVVEKRFSGVPAAENTLVTCLNLPAPPVRCAMDLARLYWDDNRPKDALKLYESIERAYPDYERVHGPMGILYFRGKNYWKAAEHLRKYLKISPRDADAREKYSDALVFCGVELLRKNQYRGALNLLTEAHALSEKNRKDAPLNLNIARAYLRLGRVQDGINYLRIAADLRPYDYKLQYDVAELFLSVGNTHGAIFFFKRSIAAQQDFADAYEALGDLYRDKLHDNAAAVVWYRKAIKAREFSAAAARSRGKLRAVTR